ncbi:hypothetical protein BC940DRAFT_341631 [Gongronella butleri]|nr:hypothetical protein BC940DRAFT_341631 [Gongronella butleri]
MCSRRRPQRPGPKWKREYVQDHKFDFIDMDEFYDRSCVTKLGYAFMYLVVLKSVLVYIADLYSGVSLLVVGQTMENNADVTIPPDVAKWIFLGAILVSYLLLFWDIRKARRIIESRDISWAFTSVIASRYYSIRDYRYFCLFWHINSSRKFIDSIAFFIFFTLKGWKRLLLAEAPRQVINIATLMVLIPKWIHQRNGAVTLDYTALGKTHIQQIMTGTMAFSVVVFAVSFFLVCVATVLYIPLLCHIQGNLKEYCCHKVDKRIAYLLRKQSLKRAKGEYIKTKKEEIEMQAFPKPTLPNLSPYSTMTSASTVMQTSYLSVNSNSKRYSGSSYNSDQLALTAHAQPPSWTPYPYYDDPGPPSATSSHTTYQLYQNYHNDPPHITYSQYY